jgi:hypothetical protein
MLQPGQVWRNHDRITAIHTEDSKLNGAMFSEAQGELHFLQILKDPTETDLIQQGFSLTQDRLVLSEN